MLKYAEGNRKKMKLKLVALLLIFFILLYPACAGKNVEESKTKPEGGGIEGAGKSIETSGEQVEEQGIDPSKFSSLSQLLSLNKPVKCEVVTKISGEAGEMQQKATYYILGEKFRVDSEIPESEMHGENIGGRATMIVKDNYVYTKLLSPIEGFDCEWLRFRTEESSASGETEATPYPGSGAAKYEPPENIKVDLNWKCEYADFGEEMFSIQGKTCDMQEMMQKIASSSMGMG